MGEDKEEGSSFGCLCNVYYIVFVYCFCTCMRNGEEKGGEEHSSVFCQVVGGFSQVAFGLGMLEQLLGGILSASVCQKMGIPATGAFLYLK